MRRAAWLVGMASALAGVLGAANAGAAPVLRVQFSQHGDMKWIGNTLAQECAATARAPVVGTIGNCGANTDDSAPDIFWRSDDPNNGQARARTQNTAAQARSTAVLALPANATVSYARLYWGAQLFTNTPDKAVTLDRPGGFTANVTADGSFSLLKAGTNNIFWYESTADVTALVRTNGVGAYRLTGVDSVNLVNFNSENPYDAWALVVFYDLPSEPLRNLALFDGLDFVSDGNPASISISGFQVPNAGFDAKLAVLAYEGDIVFNGDSLIFNGNALSDGVNPVDNFFNGSRSFLGNPVSVAGDLPQMDGLAASMSGFDLDVVDITPHVHAGDTTASVQATSSGDTYMIGAFATSIATYQPEFGTTTKTYNDLNGGIVRRGDTLEYTIVVTNTGNDAAVNTVLTDPLPVGVTFVPGSIQITAGANSGAKTDGAGDDQADYDALLRRVAARIGNGANSNSGGTVGIGESTTITFRVTIDSNSTGTIANQAIITAAGMRGNPITNYPSGNGMTPGNPTVTPVDECNSNNDCVAPRPICLMVQHPYVCVQCAVDSDCGAVDSGRVCSDDLHTCIDGCRGTGGNHCSAALVCSSLTNEIGACTVDGGVIDGGLIDASLGDATVDAGAGDGAGDGAGGSGGGGAGGAAGAGGAGGAGGAAGSGIDGAAGAGGGNVDASPDGAGRDAIADGPSGDAILDGAGDRAAPDATSDVSAGDAGADASMDGAIADASGDTGTDAASDASEDGGLIDGGSDAGPDAGGGSGGSIEGGGCSCRTSGFSGSSAGLAFVVAMLAVAGARRRRRQPAPRA